MLLIHPPPCSFHVFRKGWCSLGAGLYSAQTAASMPGMVAQHLLLQVLLVSCHSTRVISMTSRSLKSRIDECDGQTTQINKLIIEAVREMQWHAEKAHAPHFHFYFLILSAFILCHIKKWIGAACYRWWVFSLSVCPPPAASVRVTPAFSESLPSGQTGHKAIAQKQWRGQLLLEVRNGHSPSQPAGLGGLQVPSLFLHLSDWMRH